MRLYIDEKGTNSYGGGVINRKFKVITASSIMDGDSIMEAKGIEYGTPSVVTIVKRTEKTVKIQWVVNGIPMTKQLHLNTIVLREIKEQE